MYAYINQSVGKYGKNVKSDVMSIQIRINRWILEGRLPQLDLLAVDGSCGPKTKQAIGAFQLRYVVGINNPDCRVDPGGKTLETLFLPIVPPKVQDPVYYKWLSGTDWSTPEPQDKASFEKRGLFWFGVGAKVSASVNGGEGADLSLSTMYNLRNPANKFIVTAHTRRIVNLGGGFSGGAVLCFVTGILNPTDMNKIQSTNIDGNFAFGSKWASMAKWAVKLPDFVNLISFAKSARFAGLDTISKIATLLKGGIQSFGVSEEETMPNMIAIDIPIGGFGVEASVYYGITSYSVSNVALT